ncbi:Nucleotide-binding universal stress protein, UspA family [Cryptosporangium aurantiacum]|uniref:Nucleotide-binding universal stress protein, UspA family n=2 Tax=Cryptosporangium aurantiacum TaxID=134849 RepID=A0A1M7RMK9_9ACTN|nr:Nucleotide-binding universal stress protein, UspA family [Cryptosporangium aurantiacum]
MTVFDTSRSSASPMTNPVPLRPREQVQRRVTGTPRWAPAAAGIVVGVSRGDDPTGVLTWAAREARALHAPLVVCHAGNDERADAVLAEAGALARRAVPAGHVRTVRGDGRPLAVLAAAADQAGIVVVGTAAGAGSGTQLVGTIAVRLATEGRSAAVVARPPASLQPAQPQQGPFPGHVVVGVDGSPASRAALEYAFAHAAGHRRPLVAVYVTTGSAADYWHDDSLLDTVVTDDPGASALVDDEVGPFADRYRVRAASAVHRGRPLAVLSRLSRGADLLVVGVNGRPAGARARLGSTARGVLLDPPTTVAAVRA